MFLRSRTVSLTIVALAGLTAPTLGAGQRGGTATSPAAAVTTVNAVKATVTLGGGKAVTGAQGIALNPSTGLIYIGLNGTIVGGCTGQGNLTQGPGANQMSIVDPALARELAAVPTGGSPIWPTVDPDRHVVYMANSGVGTVTKHDESTGALLGTITVGGKPHQGGLDYSTRLMLVTNTVRGSTVIAEQNHASVVNTATEKVVQEFEIGPAAHAVAVDQDRDLAYATSVGNGAITAVSLVTGLPVASAIPNSVYGTAIGLNNMMARQASTRRLFQINAQQTALGILAVNEVTLALEKLIQFSGFGPAWGLWVDEGNRLLFAAFPNSNAIAVVDLDSLTHVATIPVGTCPYSVAIDATRLVGVAVNQGSPTENATASIFELCPVYAAVGRSVSGCVANVPTMAIDKTSLAFSAVSTGSAFTSRTSAQSVRLTQSGTGTVTWTAASTEPWLTVSPTSGSGAATLTVSTQFASGLASSQSGNISLTFTGANNTAGPITVTLTTVSGSAAVSPPFGVFDTPAGDGTVLAGSVPFTGWSLDNIGVQRVEIWRDLQTGETTPPFASSPTDPRNGKVFIANATFVDGARPDVEALYPTTPFKYRAGWGYLLLTWGLWNQGNGTYKLYAFALDQENNLGTIGTKTIVVSNNTATKPFGSIDVPAIGGTASGPNFGWGLTPKVNGIATCKIQPSGVQVSIDSGPLQPAVYGDARTDIAGAFTGFSNSAAAGGHYIFEWATLTNGPHTIGWLITDDCNRADGVGSRFFDVSSGTSLTADLTPAGGGAAALQAESPDPITVARGHGELPEIVTPGAAGSRTIEVRQGERIEIRLPRGFDSAYQLVSGGQRRAIPTGATWDAASGTFFWQPAAGFFGRYRIVFTKASERISVRVLVVP